MQAAPASLFGNGNLNTEDSILESDHGHKSSSIMSHREGSKFGVRSTTTDGVSR